METVNVRTQRAEGLQLIRFIWRVMEQSKVYLWAKLSVKTRMKDGSFVVVSLHKKYLVAVKKNKKTFTTNIIYSKTLEIKLLYIHTNKQAASQMFHFQPTKPTSLHSF